MEQKEEIITISLKDFFKVIWKEKIIVVTITSLFIGLGVYIAFTKQEQFTASGRILPEFETKGGGLSQFAGLASLAGISLDKASGGEAIRPDLYPDILKSIPFFNTLFEFEVVTRDNQKMTFSQFYDKVIELSAEERAEMAKAPFSLENYKKALDWFEKTDPSTLSGKQRNEYQFKQGYAYFELKDYDKAEPLFEKVKKGNLNNFLFLYYIFTFLSYQSLWVFQNLISQKPYLLNSNLL